jgi:hypothetical protein
MVLKNYFEFRLGMEIANKFGVEEEDVREAMMTPGNKNIAIVIQ